MFPVATGKPYKYNQPTNTAHIGKDYWFVKLMFHTNLVCSDVTPTWASGLAEHMNETKGIELPSKNFQFVKCVPVLVVNRPTYLILTASGNLCEGQSETGH